MKRYYAAAGALLLGTSALAWEGDTDKTFVDPVKATGEVKTMTTKDASWDKSLLATKSDIGVAETSKLGLASLDHDLEKLALAETDAKVQTASADSWSKVETAAVKPTWSDTDANAKLEMASVDKTETGMGGPLDEVDATPAVSQPSNANPEHDARGIPVISDVAYVPSGYNGSGGAVGGPVEGDEESYPACTRERTDNCIQLYERGVRDSLASTDVSTEKSSTAMGGPYEAVHSDELAMNGDGSIDVSKGEASDTELAAVETDTTLATHTDHQGVGGPVEAQSGYPPCDPGPGDDRCIQLYERGVTGAGN